MKYNFLIFVLAILLPFTALAEDISSAFCDDLSKEEIYDQNNLKNYKTMIAGKENWVFRTKTDFKKDFSLSQETKNFFAQLQDGFKRRGADLVVLIPPPRGMAHQDFISDQSKTEYGFASNDVEGAWVNYRKMLTDLRAQNINVVGIPDINGVKEFYYKRDHHWSPEGAKISAQKTAEFIKTLPSYEALEKTAFVTKKIEDRKYNGAFTKAFQKICDKNLPPQIVKTYVTERSETVSDQSSLFEDVSVPITLLGTSNSAPERNVSNFDGFLREALSLDLENRALAGAGIDSSIISYLNSQEYQESPAKIVVWEIPGYYDLERIKSKTLLQAIPATYGDCGKDAIVSKENIEIREKKTNLFSVIKDREILGKNHYLSLRFSQPVTDPFYIDIPYLRYHDTHKFQRSKRYPEADGQYYVLFHRDNKGPLHRVELNVHKNMIGLTLDAKICKIPS